MRKYEMLPIDKLVSDVAVDPVHVRELADSIKVSGPISPVLVRDESFELIDGFHRVAAMKELGFQEVESILTPCDVETFWDLRIMSATLHKAVTFARAIDWIDEAFKASPWVTKYKSPFSLFQQAERGVAPKEAIDWVEGKAKKWGLAIPTIENWLKTKEVVAEDVLAKAKEGREPLLTPRHYEELAKHLPGRFDLQRRIVDKATREGLTSKQVEEVARAVREARDEEEAQIILSEPVSRTAEELSRAARVERLISTPPVPEAAEIIQKVEMASNVIELKLVWEQVATLANEIDLALLDSLTDNQREELIESGERCIHASQKVLDYLRQKLGRLIELPEKETT